MTRRCQASLTHRKKRRRRKKLPYISMLYGASAAAQESIFSASLPSLLEHRRMSIQQTHFDSASRSAVRHTTSLWRQCRETQLARGREKQELSEYPRLHPADRPVFTCLNHILSFMRLNLHFTLSTVRFAAKNKKSGAPGVGGRGTLLIPQTLSQRPSTLTEAAVGTLLRHASRAPPPSHGRRTAGPSPARAGCPSPPPRRGPSR